MTRGLSAQQRGSIDGLVTDGVLTEEQGRRVLSELDGPDAAGTHGGVWELLGYLGGALVLGGALLLFGLTWDQLGDPGKALLLALATVLWGALAEEIDGYTSDALFAAEAEAGVTADAAGLEIY